jgi:hypothetical protein
MAVSIGVSSELQLATQR